MASDETGTFFFSYSFLYLFFLSHRTEQPRQVAVMSSRLGEIVTTSRTSPPNPTTHAT